MCYNGAWNSVCDYRWGYQEAFVVCRQLGLPATGTVIYWFHITTHACNLPTDAQAVKYINSFGYGHGIPTLNYWRCFGNETNLNDCLKSTSSYLSYRGVYSLAGVVCKGNIVSSKNDNITEILF